MKGRKRNLGPNDVGSKKCWVWQKCKVWKNLGQKDFLVPKNVRSEKVWDKKNLGSEKHLESKTNSSPNFCLYTNKVSKKVQNLVVKFIDLYEA